MQVKFYVAVGIGEGQEEIVELPDDNGCYSGYKGDGIGRADGYGNNKGYGSGSGYGYSYGYGYPDGSGTG